MSPPDPGPKPPGPRRAPSSPKILDQEPEPEVLRQRRFDSPERRQTNPGGVMVTRLPPVPELPLEVAATKPAPPPAQAGPTLRVTESGDREAIAPETPVSARAEAREALLERELAKVRAEKAELERQARVKAEAYGPATYPPAVAPMEPDRGSKPPESAPGEGSTRALRGALTKLTLALAALLALLGVPLTSYIQTLTTKVERSTNQAAQATSAADAAKAKAGTNAKEAAAWEREFRQYRSNRRELDRLQGIEYPKVEGDPDPENLEPMVPYCAAGKVCPGPQLVLRRSP